MSGLALPACLITQPIHFEEPEGFPPSIESIPGAAIPLDDVLRIVVNPSTLVEYDFDV